MYDVYSIQFSGTILTLGDIGHASGWFWLLLVGGALAMWWMQPGMPLNSARTALPVQNNAAQMSVVLTLADSAWILT